LQACPVHPQLSTSELFLVSPEFPLPQLHDHYIQGFKVKIETQVKPAAEAEPGTVLERKPTDAKLAEGAEITLIVAQE